VATQAIDGAAGGKKSIALPAMKRSPPPAIHGRRLPNRLAVRSLSVPIIGSSNELSACPTRKISPSVASGTP